MLEPYRCKGHKLFLVGEIVFCEACGRYAVSRWRKLDVWFEALGNAAPADPAARAGLKLLWAGCHPKTRAALAPPSVLTAELWRGLVGPPAAPIPVELLADAGNKRTYEEMLAEDIRLRFVIPSDARTSAGVPLGRLTKKTTDPFFAVGGVGIPARSRLGASECDSVDSGL